MKLACPDKKRILFADDDITLGGIIKLSLEHLGYEVSAVHSGFEALRIFSKNPRFFDLVILDQDMPDIKGTEVAEKLAALFPKTHIVLYTGCQNEELAAMAHTAGIEEIVSKSSTTEELLEVIDRNVDGKQKKPDRFVHLTTTGGPANLRVRERRQSSGTRVHHSR